MTQEQILEGNKLIAEFMGATVEQCYPKNKDQDGLMFFYNKESIMPPIIYTSCSSVSIAYHSSWDWLMPVLFKLKIGVTPVRKGNKIDNRGVLFIQIIKEMILNGDIEKVFENTVSCIKWYNQNK